MKSSRLKPVQILASLRRVWALRLSGEPLAFNDLLVCPVDCLPLQFRGSEGHCKRNHHYPVVQGIPVLLRDDVDDTLWVASASLASAQQAVASESEDDPYFLDTLGLTVEERESIRKQLLDNYSVDPVIGHLIGATSGFAYGHLRGNLTRYPIPAIRIAEGHGRRFLDIGCSWGRWTIAAARRGWRAIGVDPSLGAVLAARRLASTLGVDADFVVADARYLPFYPNTFDRVYSYSVLQHLSRKDLEMVLEEVGRVLNDGGSSEIQMANRYGLRGLYHQWRRGFREAVEFDVRYWSPGELRALFSSSIGPSSIDAECWFGLGLLESDRSVVGSRGKLLIDASAFVRKVSRWIPVLDRTADSVFVTSRKVT